jgi:hypothetical protein
MPLSNVERRLCWLVLGPLAALAASGAVAQISAVGPSRLVDVIQVDDHENQVDITMVFNCSMRFVTNVPANEGKEVHIQLVPLGDCRVSSFGQIASENPPLSGAANIVRGARVRHGSLIERRRRRPRIVHPAGLRAVQAENIALPSAFGSRQPSAWRAADRASA